MTTIPYPGSLTPSANITNGDFLEPVTIDPSLKMPTSYSYNIGVQHQITSRTTIEVNYVGNHSIHGLRQVDGAPPQPALVQKLLASGVPASQLQRNNLYLGGAYGSNNTPYEPAVNNSAFFHDLIQTSVVSGNYNALQVTVHGQVGSLTLMSSYTWAHSLDNGSDPIAPGAGNAGFPRDSFNLAPEYGNSPFDVRNRGSIAAIYNVPIGIGTAHLNSGFLGHVFEGIEIAGVQQAQSGLPFDLRGTRDNLHTGLTNRPQLVGSPYPSGRGTLSTKGGKITGPSAKAFANAPFDKDLSVHRNGFYGPGFVNTDLTLQKTQTLHEQIKLVFRAESYNVLNHPNLAAPGALTITSPVFGISQSELGQNDGTTGSRQIQGALKLIF